MPFPSQWFFASTVSMFHIIIYVHSQVSLVLCVDAVCGSYATMREQVLEPVKLWTVPLTVSTALAQVPASLCCDLIKIIFLSYLTLARLGWASHMVINLTVICAPKKLYIHPNTVLGQVVACTSTGEPSFFIPYTPVLRVIPSNRAFLNIQTRMKVAGYQGSERNICAGGISEKCSKCMHDHAWCLLASLNSGEMGLETSPPSWHWHTVCSLMEMGWLQSPQGIVKWS